MMDTFPPRARGGDDHDGEILAAEDLAVLSEDVAHRVITASIAAISTNQVIQAQGSEVPSGKDFFLDFFLGKGFIVRIL